MDGADEHQFAISVDGRHEADGRGGERVHEDKRGVEGGSAGVRTVDGAHSLVEVGVEVGEGPRRAAEGVAEEEASGEKPQGKRRRSRRTNPSGEQKAQPADESERGAEDAPAIIYTPGGYPLSPPVLPPSPVSTPEPPLPLFSKVVRVAKDRGDRWSGTILEFQYKSGVEWWCKVGWMHSAEEWVPLSSVKVWVHTRKRKVRG